MRTADIQIKEHDLKVPVNSVLLETYYFCAKCGSLIASDRLVQRKHGSSCPLCESRSIYPIVGLLNGKGNGHP